jgi:hypothetical protein
MKLFPIEQELEEELSSWQSVTGKNKCIVKYVYGKYENTDATENVLHYISDHPIKNGCNGIGCSSNENTAIKDFHATQKLYHKSDGKQLRHIVVAFTESMVINAINIQYIAYAIAHYFFNQGFQVYYGIHNSNFSDKAFHIHLAVNHVSFLNGTRINSDIKSKYDFINYIKQLPYNLEVRPATKYH